jgi:hypothetical protein
MHQKFFGKDSVFIGELRPHLSGGLTFSCINSTTLDHERAKKNLPLPSKAEIIYLDGGNFMFWTL